VALKEWASLVRALREGRQAILLRKGGIRDANGVFTLQEKEFFLYPTLEHQKDHLVQACWAGEMAASRREYPADKTILIDTYAVAEKVRVVSSESEFPTLLKRSVWSLDYFQQRWEYKPEKPLYLVGVRAFKLKTPHRIPEAPSYAGCVSWVPLEKELATGPSEPAIENEAFDREMRELF
jgi:hypothetical protein